MSAMEIQVLRAPDQPNHPDQAAIRRAQPTQAARLSEAAEQFLNKGTTLRDTQNHPQPPPERPHSLPFFEMPGIKPLSFSKVPHNCTVYKLQNYIDDYLERSYELCKLYRFAPSTAEITKQNQPTYVEFTSLGLKGDARAAWHRIPSHERQNMSWTDYAAWIQKNYGPHLEIDQVIQDFDDLCQTESVADYTYKFNSIVSAASSVGVDFPVKYLCWKYRRGLKMNVHTVLELNRITDNLDELQTKAKSLNEITSRNCKHNNAANSC
ncbi:hypothetical protein HDU81_001621 [Chytriomyces hyalinus]|nr:hypothetical protein HDU81_001621 [Chytriomyces hyalinus]